MKIIIVCMFAFLAVGLAKPEEQYTNKYDNFDVQAVLDNARLLKNYAACLLETGKCTSEGKELRSHLKDAIQTDCLKCTPAQRSAVERVIAHLLKHEPEIWNKLQAKYDPTGEYTKSHEAQLKSLAS